MNSKMDRLYDKQLDIHCNMTAFNLPLCKWRLNVDRNTHSTRRVCARRQLRQQSGQVRCIENLKNCRNHRERN